MDYLQPSTQEALKTKMMQDLDPTDSPGFIYAFEITGK